MMKRNDLKPFILLSLLPLIYLSTQLSIALWMGLIYSVLTLVVIGLGILIDKYLNGRIRIYTYLILMAAIITITMTILTAYVEINQWIGIYVALTLFLIPTLKEQKEPISVWNQLFMLGVSLLTLILIGLFREVLSTGAINLFESNIQIFDGKYAITFFKDNSGGFILAGFIFAFIQVIPFQREVRNDVV
ncbi:hypothetical protein Aocu_13900 [Acholeplasma oculi]|uniref:Uncharacterized protein n=2 Tax=Acholeplasma oculi TaxID=35623 RepID=A0A061ACA3_9MOLU|nr:hypothetical protein Aocu_13900 [Acholeplasma oculi]